MPQAYINYTANNKQELFHESGADECFFGGAKGGGKSTALVMDALKYALENKGASIYLFRRKYQDLEANLIREWRDKVPRELYTYDKSRHEAYLKNGSTVFFRYITSIEVADEYRGYSMDYIGLDELTLYEEEAVQILLSCLRSVKFRPIFRATGNPGGLGHHWVRKRYILPTEYGRKMYKDQRSGNVIEFIPAKVYDNFVLMQNDPAYIRRLENLPPAQRAAFLDGDWDSYDGQAFPEWNPDIHVCSPFSIPSHWKRWRSGDNGYTDSFAFYWHAIGEDGTVYTYREYTRDKDDPKVTYSDQAREIIRRSRMTIFESGEAIDAPEKIDYTVVGHDAWNPHPLSEGKAIIDYYEAGGLFGCVRAITDRRLRKATIHEYLKPYQDENTGKMTAKVKVFSTCKKLIETLPLIIEDEDDPEKYSDDQGIDHWIDGWGYGLVSYHAAKSRDPNVPTVKEIKRLKMRLVKKHDMRRIC